jgi:hypothetical protein
VQSVIPAELVLVETESGNPEQSSEGHAPSWPLRQKLQAVLQDPAIMEVVCKSSQGGERHGVQEDREK